MSEKLSDDTLMQPLIVANASAFFGDRFNAPAEMVRGGPIDVLTGDYLAELTMALLHRLRMKGKPAYVPIFVRQVEDVLAECLERKIRIVSNAGGLDPRGLAAELEAVAKKRGLRARVAVVEGDDVSARYPEAITANAYLGSWGIREALRRDADIVITGRVTDAALVVGPAAWRFDWARDDYDRLAGALVAGHILECGAQATGGNYSFFREVKSFAKIGFPLAEVHDDGSFVITKHPNTGGLVSIGTVTAQVLYEIEGLRYPSPDVVARFDTIELTEEGDDRVLVRGVRGEPPPETAKVCRNTFGGFRNEMRMMVPAPDIDAKVEVIRAMIDERIVRPDRLELQLLRTDRDDPATNVDALATLRVMALDADGQKIGRAFSSAIVELATASVPGLSLATPPGDATPFAVLRSTTIPWSEVQERVVIDGETIAIDPPRGSSRVRDDSIDVPLVDLGQTTRVPFGELFGARSGDKGSDATLGVWARDDAAHAFLRDHFGIARLQHVLPELASHAIERYLLPNLHAVLFVVRGLLGEGVASSTRIDPQAKSLGEWLRSRVIEVPVSVAAHRPRATS
jgi:hypothetical protein